MREITYSDTGVHMSHGFPSCCCCCPRASPQLLSCPVGCLSAQRGPTSFPALPIVLHTPVELLCSEPLRPFPWLLRGSLQSLLWLVNACVICCLRTSWPGTSSHPIFCYLATGLLSIPRRPSTFSDPGTLYAILSGMSLSLTPLQPTPFI